MRPTVHVGRINIIYRTMMVHDMMNDDAGKLS